MALSKGFILPLKEFQSATLGVKAVMTLFLNFSILNCVGIIKFNPQL
tara:strand:- start:349 stop:489 length:141 start_codon:yes stop_codon:yes gene_type:complete